MEVRFWDGMSFGVWSYERVGRMVLSEFGSEFQFYWCLDKWFSFFCE